MRKEHHHDPQLSLDAGYEVSDMNVSIIVKFGVAFALTIFCSVIIVIGIIRAMDRRPAMNVSEASALTSELRQPPKGVQLQTDPVGDKREILGAAAQHLNSFGVVETNPEAGRAHIPIAMAMDLVAEGRVPYRQQPFTARLGAGTDAAVAAPAEPGAGAALPAAGAPDVPATTTQPAQGATEVAGQ